MTAGGNVLRVVGWDVIEAEVKKNRIVYSPQFSVIVPKSETVLIDDFRHRNRALIREIRAVDQVPQWEFAAIPETDVHIFQFLIRGIP